MSFLPFDDPNLLALIIQYAPYDIFCRPPNHAWRAAAAAIIEADQPYFDYVTIDLAKHWPGLVGWFDVSCAVPFGDIGPVVNWIQWRIIWDRIVNKRDNIKTSHGALRVAPAVLDFIVCYGDWLGWDKICREIELPMEAIRANVARVDTKAICKFQCLDSDFIREHADRLDWQAMSPRLADKTIIREFAARINWSKLSINNIGEELMGEFPAKINWHNYCKYSQISGEFMRDVADHLDWPRVSRYQKLGEEFMREFASRLDWTAISGHQSMSEAFMREFADRLNWYKVSQYQILSEAFMDDFALRLDWCRATRYQDMSDEFLGRHADRVDWYTLLYKGLPSVAIIRAYADRLDWEIIRRIILENGTDQYLDLLDEFHWAVAGKPLVDLAIGPNMHSVFNAIGQVTSARWLPLLNSLD